MTFGIDPTAGAKGPTGSSRKAQPALITAAEPSYDDQLRSRRIRYSIMMGLRIPCLIIAALLYQTPWLAITVAAISIPLPWMAVLIANDRPAQKRRPVAPAPVNPERALTSGTHEIVDGSTTADPR
jgi:hypothetical protein